MHEYIWVVMHEYIWVVFGKCYNNVLDMLVSRKPKSVMHCLPKG